MRRNALFLSVILASLVSAPLLAQTAGGRWEARSPRFYSVPQTAWVKAEVLSDDPVSVQVGAAMNDQLRRLGYDPGPGGAYSVRLELRGRGLSTPVVPIPGYSNVTQRLAVWPEADRPDTVYVSLVLYHQSTGQIIWQGEAACPGLKPDARNIVNAMVGPMMNRLGTTGKGALGCYSI
jgi:hypothetical protein